MRRETRQSDSLIMAYLDINSDIFRYPFQLPESSWSWVSERCRGMIFLSPFHDEECEAEVTPPTSQSCLVGTWVRSEHRTVDCFCVIIECNAAQKAKKEGRRRKMVATTFELGFLLVRNCEFIYYAAKEGTATNIEVKDKQLLFHFLQVVTIRLLSTRLCSGPFLPAFTKINEFHSYKAEMKACKYLLNSL